MSSSQVMDPVSATYTNADAKRRDLEAEETRLCLALQSVRARINNFATVNTLPPETLLQIFSDIASIDFPFVDKNRHIPANLGWIRTITHVCQHWRHTALAAPLLWTNIYTHLGPRWAEEMFQRSRNIPVSLSWAVPEDFTATQLDEYLHSQLSQSNVFANIRTLNLAGNVYMIPLLVHPAPALEELILHNSLEYVDLPAHFFGDSAPKLRTLYLCQCSVPWGSPVLNNLTHLTVIYPSCYPDASGAPVYDDEENHPTNAQVLAFLRNAPSLELLSLSHALPVVSMDASPASGSPVITLPHLKTLALTGRVVDCLALLRLISFPPTANLTLSCTADTGAPPGERLLDIVPLLVARVEDPAYNNSPIQEFHIRKNDRLTISVSIDAPSCISTIPGTTTPQMGANSKRVNVFTAIFNDSYDDLAYQASVDIIRSLCRALPLYDRVVDLLSFESRREDLAKRDWLNIFFPFRHIRRMDYSGLMLPYAPPDTTIPPSSSSQLPFHFNGPISEEQVALEPRGIQQSSPEGDRTRPIFPGLRSLKFKNMDFGRGPRVGLYAQGFLRDLVWQMEGRKREGAPLEELVIEDPMKVSVMEQCKADIERLREVVNVVRFE